MLGMRFCTAGAGARRLTSGLLAGCVGGLLWMLAAASLPASARASEETPFAPIAPSTVLLPGSLPETELATASATAYESLTPAQSRQLLSEAFPALLAPTATPSPPQGTQIVKYLSPETAQLALPNGGHGVLQAASPIAAREPSGGWGPIDLSLSEAGAAWQPTHAQAGVRIPGNLKEGIVLSGAHVSLLPLGADGLQLAAGEGALDGAGVFYPGVSVGTDTDVAVKPTSEGFEENTLLRSQRSPSTLSFAVGMPAGARLVQDQESGAIEVVKDGKVLASMLPIEAQDAAGAPVPTSVSVEQDVISVSVADATGAVCFPVAVDPTWIDKEAKLKKGTEAGNWAFWGSNSLTFSSSIASDTLTDQDALGKAFVSGENGFFGYSTQKESRIYELLGNLHEANSGSEAVRNELIIGHTIVKEGKEEIFTTEKSEPFTPHGTEFTVTGAKVCLEAACNAQPVTESTDGNTAIFKQNAIANGSYFNAKLEAAAVYINQEKAPSATFDTTDATIEGRPNPLIAGNWVSTKKGSPGHVAIDAVDPGIGIDAQSLTSPNKAGWSIASNHTTLNGCEGAQCNECYEPTCVKEGVSGNGKPLIFSISESSELPEGEDTLEGKVEDTTGLSAKTSAKVHVDNAPPYNIAVAGLPAGDAITEAAYHFTVSATDGAGGIESSGIESIKVTIDGLPLESPSGGCSPGPCTATGHWTIDGWKYGNGPHVFTIMATDRAGNVTEEHLTLTVHRAEPLSIGPGTVDPVTGRFDLASQDVAISTGGPALTVGRTYDSREPAAGEAGPLGPQWSLGLGSSQSLVEGSNGAMVLKSSTGAVTTFSSNGKGGFNSPPGDANLTLKEELVEFKRQYTLSDSSTNSSTTYQMPNNWSAFTAASYPKTIAPSGEFNIRNLEPADSIECRYTGSGEITGPSWSVGISPTPSSCKSFVYHSPTIKMNGCQLILIAEGEQAALGHCKGKDMVVEAPHECVMEMPEQLFPEHEEIGSVSYREKGKTVIFEPELQYKIASGCYTTEGFPILLQAKVSSWERTVRRPVWMPAIQTGPVAADTMTFQWEGVNGKVEPVQELAPPPPGVSCAPELKRGCKALSFNYAKETTAKGEAPSEWGDYNGNLTRVYLTSWEPVTEKMTTVTVAQYTYDSKGRLRAEWDPRISPALKSTYAYDSEGHVVALTPPGQQPWLMHYGALGEDPNTGRLLSVARPPASKAAGNGLAPVNTVAPTLSTTAPSVGHEIKVSSNGTWSNSPLTYSYQWQRCEAGGAKCAPIAGAVNAGYYPVAADEGHALEAIVTATSAAGAVSQASAATSAVGTGTPSEALPAPPASEGNAITTIDYGVPLSGASAPHQLGAKEAEAWAQEDDPLEATAIFPPDEPMGWPAKDYKRASIRYLDSHALPVDQAGPNGGIAVSEYNEYNEVKRSLSADNRATALKEGAKSAEVSKRLDTESKYGAEGLQLESTLGPEHVVKLAGGKEAQARSHALYYYNEGAPTEGGPYHLVTKMTQGVEVSGEPEQDVRTSTTSYSGQENLGWKLRKPTSTTADPAGLKSTHTTIFSPSTGEALETRAPASPGEHSAHDTVSVYYTAEANSTYPECGGHAEWAGLPCKSLPGGQPKTEGLPELPATTIETYNQLDEPLKSTQKSGASTRTTTSTYDEAGRLSSSQTTATSGTSLPAVKDRYSEQTGALVEESETVEAKTISLLGELNSLGQLERYTDATGNVSTFAYDIDGRPTEANDGKGIQKLVYDPTTGFETELTDSAAGTFKATYDAEGNIATESLPNGMTVTYTRNAAGLLRALSYVKTTHCTENCTWYSDSIVPGPHGQWASQSSTLASNLYTYDSLGRLTQVQDTPAGKGCAVRVYGYDAETNRTSLTSREPGSKGECLSTGGSVESHSYDEGNRLTDAGVGYDPFGDLTKLSALDAGGSVMESTYYVDGQAASLSQNGEAITYDLDPEGRQSEAVLTGKTANVLISHYSGPGKVPAWTTEASGKWSRNIAGIGGLDAIQADAETPQIQISNLHGDIVASVPDEETATKLGSTAETTEFGVPTTGAPSRYSWLGTQEEPTELPSGAMEMGARTYIPQIGRFMQPDPVQGGTSNTYGYTSGDPLGETDLTGRYDMVLSAVIIAAENEQSLHEAEQRAAEEAAARAQAEREAEEAMAEAAAYAGMMEGWGGEEGWGEEEEYEEEGGYGEYASYHQGSETSHDALADTTVLFQPLAETPLSTPVSQTGAMSEAMNRALQLCQTMGHDTSTACARLINYVIKMNRRKMRKFGSIAVEGGDIAEALPIPNVVASLIAKAGGAYLKALGEAMLNAAKMRGKGGCFLSFHTIKVPIVGDTGVPDGAYAAGCGR